VTGEAARWFNLAAGELREGRRADVVVLQPDALKEPIPVPVEVEDALLDGARRMVKRGAEKLVRSVYIGGMEVVRDGAPLPALGRARAGMLLEPSVKVRGARAVLERYRNRIDESTFDHPFRSYWEVFVFKHQQPWNVALHCVAVLLMYCALAGLVLSPSVWWLLLVVFSQAIGFAGHLLFERSHVDTRDAVFSWRASWCLNRMFFSVLSRSYWLEVGRVRTRFAEYQEAPG